MTKSKRMPMGQDCLCDSGNPPMTIRPPTIDDNMAVLGHEIRNPLSALTYALEAWPADNTDPQLAQRLLQIMRRQVKQLTRLCDDLLDAGKSRQGKLSINSASMDIRRALQNAVEEVRPFAESSGLSLTVDHGGRSYGYIGDESRLTQVFANVMHNAAKFTGRGGFLHVTMENHDNAVVVRFCDNGRGICSERLNELFAPTNVSKKCSEIAGEGLGIGLRLAKSIVALHGGSIEAFSEGIGYGCTFVITLPLPVENCVANAEESVLQFSSVRTLDTSGTIAR